MATTITLTGTASAGVNYDTYGSEFFSSFDMAGYPSFIDDQIYMTGTVSATDAASTDLIVIDGSDFAYYYPTHTVSGTATTVSLGTLGSAVSSTGTISEDSEGRIQNYSAAVTISGLSISNPSSVQGDLHSFVASLMGFSGTADASVLLNAIAADSIILNGSVGGDTFTGGAYADTLSGNAGNDTLSGGAGNDVIDGGTGNDSLLGGAGKDTLTGGAGNDTLDGGTGVDRLEGGKGNDTYIVDSAKDVVIEAKTAGTDTVRASVSYTLSDNVEKLVLTGTKSISGTGNDLNNVITGNSGANTLTGGAGKDTISAGAGNDKLIGGAGADKLTGGAGADQFIYKALSDSTVGASGRDTITDFSSDQNDRINLSAIDADSTVSGNQKFTFLGEADFTGSAGELTYSVLKSGALVSADTDGDGSADFSVFLKGVSVLDAGDFVL